MFLCNLLKYENWINTCINNQLKWRYMPKYRSLFSLCKQRDSINNSYTYKSFFKSKKNTHVQVDPIKWDKLFSHFAVAKINKRPNRHARKSEYRGKLKTRPKRTKRSVPETFRSVPKTFRSVPKAFRSVLEAFRFVQTVQRSRGVVVRFRVCNYW